MQDVEFVKCLLEASGLSQRDAAQYLVARGRKASFGAIQAWFRGLYQFPEDVVDDLLKLSEMVRDASSTSLVDELGVPYPAGVLRRRQAHAEIRDRLQGRDAHVVATSEPDAPTRFAPRQFRRSPDARAVEKDVADAITTGRVAAVCVPVVWPNLVGTSALRDLPEVVGVEYAVVKPVGRVGVLLLDEAVDMDVYERSLRHRVSEASGGGAAYHVLEMKSEEGLDLSTVPSFDAKAFTMLDLVRLVAAEGRRRTIQADMQMEAVSRPSASPWAPRT